MDKKFLLELLSQPTAPFREVHVVKTIVEYLDHHAVPYFRDKIGNICVGVASEEEYRTLVQKKTSEPLRLFVAHMDHPGFHGVKWKTKNDLEVKWHGGSPRKHLNGSRVWLATISGVIAHGTLKNVKMNASKTAIEKATVHLETEVREGETEPETIFGAFEFRAPVWQKKDILYTKAADDLVGCFAIISLAVELKKRHLNPGSFIGILTRAEEVGFIGAIGHFESGLQTQAKRPLLCVSLETSRTLPGAIVGKGPVVRLGDRATTFDSGSLEVFSQIANEVLPGKHQRRVMDGGTCEATAAMAYEIPAIGISIPLGNYHNQSFEGGPDSRGEWGPAPEFVSVKDIQGMQSLCLGLMHSGLAFADPFHKRREGLKKRYREYESFLSLS